MKLTWPAHVILLKNDGQVHETAVIDVPCEIENDAHIWHFAHVMEGAKIGDHTTIGQGVHVARGVQIGARCHIQNGAQLFTGVEIGDDVFIGPHVVFTNIKVPRAHISRKHEFLLTIVRRGTSIGANATILCGVTIGSFATIGAGAVVTHDVKPHEMVVGNPARNCGWVCLCGEPLPVGDACLCGQRFRRTESGVELY